MLLGICLFVWPKWKVVRAILEVLIFFKYFCWYKYKNTIPIYRYSDNKPSSDVQDEAEVRSDLQSVSSINSDTETSEDDQQTEDSDMSRDCLVLPINLEAGDDVCVKLDHLVRNEMLSKDDIFYNYIKDVVHFYSNLRKHQYDEEVVVKVPLTFWEDQLVTGKEEEAKVILRAKQKGETFMVHFQLHVQNGRGVTQ